MTPHFNASELVCQCGCGMLPKLASVERLERVRVRVGFPLPVTSAARCPKHNAAVSSTGENGPHTTGCAFDLGVDGAKALMLIIAAREEGFTGIGVNQKGKARFVHIDDLPNAPGQPRPWCWSY